jgi:hypothetical protein
VSEEPGGGASTTTDPAAGTSTGTDVSLDRFTSRELWWLDRLLQERHLASIRFGEERDRRYAEVGIEREKALAIKERADETARILVAENQAYRDEKANQLREQIGSERNLYVTKEELKPFANFVNAQQGRSEGIGVSANALVIGVGLVIAALSLYLGLN